MKVTVIFPDNSIYVDNIVKFFDSVVPLDPNWRVMQWYDTYGDIEVYVGDRIWLDNISLVQPYIDQWESQPIIVDEVLPNSNDPQNGPSVVA